MLKAFDYFTNTTSYKEQNTKLWNVTNASKCDANVVIVDAIELLLRSKDYYLDLGGRHVYDVETMFGYDFAYIWYQFLARTARLYPNAKSIDLVFGRSNDIDFGVKETDKKSSTWIEERIKALKELFKSDDIQPSFFYLNDYICENKKENFQDIVQNKKLRTEIMCFVLSAHKTFEDMANKQARDFENTDERLSPLFHRIQKKELKINFHFGEKKYLQLLSEDEKIKCEEIGDEQNMSSSVSTLGIIMKIIEAQNNKDRPSIEVVTPNINALPMCMLHFTDNKNIVIRQDILQPQVNVVKRIMNAPSMIKKSNSLKDLYQHVKTQKTISTTDLHLVEQNKDYDGVDKVYASLIQYEANRKTDNYRYTIDLQEFIKVIVEGKENIQTFCLAMAMSCLNPYSVLENITLESIWKYRRPLIMNQSLYFNYDEKNKIWQLDKKQIILYVLQIIYKRNDIGYDVKKYLRDMIYTNDTSLSHEDIVWKDKDDVLFDYLKNNIMRKDLRFHENFNQVILPILWTLVYWTIGDDTYFENNDGYQKKEGGNGNGYVMYSKFGMRFIFISKEKYEMVKRKMNNKDSLNFTEDELYLLSYDELTALQVEHIPNAKSLWNKKLTTYKKEVMSIVAKNSSILKAFQSNTNKTQVQIDAFKNQNEQLEKQKHDLENNIKMIKDSIQSWVQGGALNNNLEEFRILLKKNMHRLTTKEYIMEYSYYEDNSSDPSCIGQYSTIDISRPKKIQVNIQQYYPRYMKIDDYKVQKIITEKTKDNTTAMKINKQKKTMYDEKDSKEFNEFIHDTVKKKINAHIMYKTKSLTYYEEKKKMFGFKEGKVHFDGLEIIFNDLYISEVLMICDYIIQKQESWWIVFNWEDPTNQNEIEAVLKKSFKIEISSSKKKNDIITVSPLKN